jgi:putative ABC transport system ATP-binding protein
MSVILHVEALGYQRDTVVAGERGFAMEVGALALREGESVGIVGPSGCGKSTLIDLLALLRKPSRATRFELMHHDVVALWHLGALQACNALRAAHVGVVLQTGGLLPALTVRENVLLSQRLLGAVDATWVAHLLDALELSGLATRRPAQLSIGQRQRVAIARALAHRPALVLADEPTASLGVDHAPAALDLLLSLARDSGAALLVVSHDVALLESRHIPLRPFALRGGVISLEGA